MGHRSLLHLEPIDARIELGSNTVKRSASSLAVLRGLSALCACLGSLGNLGTTKFFSAQTPIPKNHFFCAA